VESIPPDAPASTPTELMLMQYNVENLFDPADDPLKDDDSFTPKGRDRWTEAKLDQKLRQLARVIGFVNGGRGPDVLALQEVENIDVLKRLCSEHLGGLGYKEPILVEGPDVRGIDVALLTRLPLAEAAVDGGPAVRAHDPSRETWRKKSRLILEAALDAGAGRTLTVFAVHFPSRRGGAAAEQERAEAASALRERAKALLAVDPDAEVVMAGDFNDGLRDHPIREVLKAAGDPAAAVASTADDPVFFDAVWDAARWKPAPAPPEPSQPPARPAPGGAQTLPLTPERIATTESPRGRRSTPRLRAALDASPGRSPLAVSAGAPGAPGRVGTHFFARGKKWSALDHVILSKGLLDARGLTYVVGSAQVVHPQFMKLWGSGAPKRFMPPGWWKKKGEWLPGPEKLGFSDHFPVVVRFDRASKGGER
jgi:endonuclease/exonuclease/phosphatase family metal-dependent hydrolase